MYAIDVYKRQRYRRMVLFIINHFISDLFQGLFPFLCFIFDKMCIRDRHGSQLAGGHQLPAQPLGLLVVAFRLPTGAALGLHGDGGLSQPVLGNLLDGGAFPATQEDHAVHVSQEMCIRDSFWLTPQLLQAHSSYVCVDPKGGVLSQVGACLLYTSCGGENFVKCT